MADDAPDDLDSLFDDAQSATPDAENTDLGSLEAGSDLEASIGSGNDTLKSQEVQAQEEVHAQKTGVAQATRVTERRETVLQRIAREAKEEAESFFYHGAAKKTDNPNQNAHFRDKKAELNELLAWKERLKLRAVTEFIPQPYYNSWNKEANLFFRRLVIIKRRMKNLED